MLPSGARLDHPDSEPCIICKMNTYIDNTNKETHLPLITLDKSKTYPLKELLFASVAQHEPVEQCDWHCDKHPNLRCGGVYEHGAEHQCPECYKGKTEDEVIESYVRKRFKS